MCSRQAWASMCRTKKDAAVSLLPLAPLEMPTVPAEAVMEEERKAQSQSIFPHQPPSPDQPRLLRAFLKTRKGATTIAKELEARTSWLPRIRRDGVASLGPPERKEMRQHHWTATGKDKSLPELYPARSFLASSTPADMQGWLGLAMDR